MITEVRAKRRGRPPGGPPNFVFGDIGPPWTPVSQGQTFLRLAPFSRIKAKVTQKDLSVNKKTFKSRNLRSNHLSESLRRDKHIATRPNYETLAAFEN